jgi:hypothetical protein
VGARLVRARVVHRRDGKANGGQPEWAEGGAGRRVLLRRHVVQQPRADHALALHQDSRGQPGRRRRPVATRPPPALRGRAARGRAQLLPRLHSGSLASSPPRLPALASGLLPSCRHGRGHCREGGGDPGGVPRQAVAQERGRAQGEPRERRARHPEAAAAQVGHIRDRRRSGWARAAARRPRPPARAGAAPLVPRLWCRAASLVPPVI